MRLCVLKVLRARASHTTLGTGFGGFMGIDCFRGWMVQEVAAGGRPSTHTLSQHSAPDCTLEPSPCLGKAEGALSMCRPTSPLVASIPKHPSRVSGCQPGIFQPRERGFLHQGTRGSGDRRGREGERKIGRTNP